MSNRPTISIDFGALCYPIAKQLEDQGIIINVNMRDNVTVWQKDADAITRLAVKQLLPGSAVKTARQKLLKKIVRKIEAEIT